MSNNIETIEHCSASQISQKGINYIYFYSRNQIRTGLVPNSKIKSSFKPEIILAIFCLIQFKFKPLKLETEVKVNFNLIFFLIFKQSIVISWD